MNASTSVAPLIPGASAGLLAAPGAQQNQTQYEVLLFGEFVNEHGRLEAILNRLSLVSDGGATHVQFAEWHFEPHQRPEGSDPVFLMARREKGAPSWVLHSHLKPESTRVNPEATVRAATYASVEGHALDFVSALGFRLRFKVHKRGYLFRRGFLTITMLQLDQIDPKTRKVVPAHASAPWQVQCRAYTKDIPLQQAVDAVLELQLIVKGWLDLARQE